MGAARVFKHALGASRLGLSDLGAEGLSSGVCAWVWVRGFLLVVRSRLFSKGAPHVPGANGAVGAPAFAERQSSLGRGLCFLP